MGRAKAPLAPPLPPVPPPLCAVHIGLKCLSHTPGIEIMAGHLACAARALPLSYDTQTATTPSQSTAQVGNEKISWLSNCHSSVVRIAIQLHL